jgi:hypothetical protein
VPVELPPEAVDAARKHLAGFPSGSRARGLDYFQRDRVIELEEVDAAAWYAVVSGTEEYSVSLAYEERAWNSECSCPVGTSCKHIYAAMKALLRDAVPAAKITAVVQEDAAPPARARKKAAKPVAFKEIVAARLGRRLTADELRISSNVQQVFQRFRALNEVPEYILSGISGGDPYAWRGHRVWDKKPADVWEAWLYLAYTLRLLKRRIPPFLAAITREDEMEATIGEYMREREVERWSNLLAEMSTKAVPVKALDLRAVFDSDRVRLEFAEPGGTWAILKKTRHDQILRGTASPLANDDARLLWAAYHKGYVTDGTLPYDNTACAPGIGELLRNPLLVDRIVGADRTPMKRSPEKLQWRMDDPDQQRDVYRLALTLPDGSTPPEPLLCLDGNPSLYVTADTVFEGPPFGALSPTPTVSNRIPSVVMESSAGVSLLERLALPLPEKIAAKIELLKARLVIEAEVEERWQVEHLEVRFIAEWGNAAPPEVYTGNAWRPVANPPAPASQRIVHFDRAPLEPVPELIERLAVSSNSMDGVWTRKLGRSFPEQFSAWLLTLPPHAELRLSPELASLREGPVTGSFKLEVEPAGVDWFDVQTVLTVKDVEFSPAELKALLDAKGKWVRLGQKGWRKLALQWDDDDEEALSELGLTARDLSGEPQRLHALQLASEKARNVLPAAHFDAVRRRVDELQTRVNPPVPPNITAELRPYQVEGFHFLAYLSTNRFGGVLADDMGLGKTLQTLTWLAWLRAENPKNRKPSLVVCPKSVTANWQSEAAKFLPDLSVQVWSQGTAKALKTATSNADLIVLNYAQLRVMSDELSKRPWFTVILDEAQAIKNPDSQTARAACQLQADHRLALSGTPVENRLLDLWSILAFAMPGVLGQRAKFAKQYDKAGDDRFARRRLAARVRPFLLRRTKNQVAKDLPPRTEEDLLCHLEGKQETLYQAELKRARQMLLKVGSTKELDKQRFNILTCLLRLRQICCHPALVDTNAAGAGSAKMDALLELLDPLMQEGHKVLVFSQFVGVLELIRDEIVKREWSYSMLTGDTENRGELVSEFQAAPGARVFLLSLKAGGAGLNLTAASYVVLFDPWWNPAVENQAIDRTHRIGQTEHVNAYRLLIQNTIEEKIRNLQKSKSALAEDILGEEAFARTLTLQDFQFLLGTNDDTPETRPLAPQPNHIE